MPGIAVGAETLRLVADAEDIQAQRDDREQDQDPGSRR